MFGTLYFAEMYFAAALSVVAVPSVAQSIDIALSSISPGVILGADTNSFTLASGSANITIENEVI